MTIICGSAITTQASRAAYSRRVARQRADAHLAVALDGLEIVQRHDAVRAEAVERGDSDDGQLGRPPVMMAAAVIQGRPS